MKSTHTQFSVFPWSASGQRLALTTAVLLLLSAPTAQAQQDDSQRQPAEPPAFGQQDRSAPNSQSPNDRPNDWNDRAEGPSKRGTGKPYEQAFGKDGLPKTPKQRAKVLSNLYAYLATAPDAETAAEIASVVERLWYISGSDTISLLMDRSLRAVSAKKYDLATRLLDAVVDLAPDYAEGWNRRAFVHYLQDNRARAAGDLRRVLALEPNHFKALQGLAQLLADAGEKKAALKAYRKLIEIHPYAENVEETIKQLEVEIEGQRI